MSFLWISIPPSSLMAGLDRAIHVDRPRKLVDDRAKPGHDGTRGARRQHKKFLQCSR
jgi:hypothetical protein